MEEFIHPDSKDYPIGGVTWNIPNVWKPQGSPALDGLKAEVERLNAKVDELEKTVTACTRQIDQLTRKLAALDSDGGK